MSGPAFRMHRLGDSLTVCDESVVHAPEMIAHRPGKWASHLAGYLPKRSKRGEKIAGGLRILTAVSRGVGGREEWIPDVAERHATSRLSVSPNSVQRFSINARRSCEHQG